MDHTFHVISKNSSSNPRSARLSPIISRHFIVSHFTFRSVFSDDSHSLNTKHWPDKITIETWGSLLSGLHAEIIVATCGYFCQSDSSNISKLNNQRNQEILKSDFFSSKGEESKKWHFLHASNVFNLPIYGKYIYSSFIAKFLNISRRKALSKEHRLAYVKRRKWWWIVTKCSLNSHSTSPFHHKIFAMIFLFKKKVKFLLISLTLRTESYLSKYNYTLKKRWGSKAETPIYPI